MAINNSVILTGNMGSEADIIQMEGRTFAAVSIATTDSYQDDKGEWQDMATIWHNVLTFNPRLIEVLRNLKKGSRIEITGSLSYRPYTVAVSDKEGEPKEITKYEASVIARKVTLAPLVKKSNQS